MCLAPQTLDAPGWGIPRGQPPDIDTHSEEKRRRDGGKDYEEGMTRRETVSGM